MSPLSLYVIGLLIGIGLAIAGTPFHSVIVFAVAYAIGVAAATKE